MVPDLLGQFLGTEAGGRSARAFCQRLGGLALVGLAGHFQLKGLALSGQLGHFGLKALQLFALELDVVRDALGLQGGGIPRDERVPLGDLELIERGLDLRQCVARLGGRADGGLALGVQLDAAAALGLNLA